MSSKVDLVFRHCIKAFRRARFFERGWGTLDELKTLTAARAVAMRSAADFDSMVPPVELIAESHAKDKHVHRTVYKFESPLVSMMPGLLPRESNTARFELVQPVKTREEGRRLCIHLGSTGDHYFRRRRTILAVPLAVESGLSSAILENPYYGSRRPAGQIGSYLPRVIDIMILGAALMAECSTILRWASQRGYTHLGLSGISMGGHMASLAGSLCPRPLALSPCLASATSAHVFTEGVLGHCVAWDKLAQDLDTALQMADFLGLHVEPLKYATREALCSALLAAIYEPFLNLRHFPVPSETRACVRVIAVDDGYVPAVADLDELWPGSEVRTVSGGHVTAFIMHQRTFRAAVVDSFDRLSHFNSNLSNTSLPSHDVQSLHASL
eukprot:m.12783 g.12783  ORF g.12783 m.12783 type:complete len:384 (-) comp6069_c0_seq1:24-1175(-)